MQQTTGSVCRGSCRSLERTASLHTASYRVAVWCVAWDGRIGLLVNSIQPCFLLHPGVVCRSAAAERLPRLRHVSDARACDDGFPLYLPLWKMRRVRGEGHAFKTTNTGRKHRIPGSVAKVSTSGVWVVCLLGKGPRAKINENLAQRYCTAVASKMLEYEQEYKHTELCRSPSRSPPPGSLPALRHSVSMGFPPHASAKPRTLSREDRSQANAPAAPDVSAAALAFASVRQATCTSCPNATF